MEEEEQPAGGGKQRRCRYGAVTAGDGGRRGEGEAREGRLRGEGRRRTVMNAMAAESWRELE